jgi:type I restriction enzyme R subunit
MAKEFYVPAKRLAYLLMRMRNRYKDDTLDLKWAGAKVRKLIDKYLESLGINPKIPPVKLLSDDFPKTIDAHNKSGKAKASEMEHAIRWHIKVQMAKDPALYTMFSERLQRILDAHKEHWDVIVAELTNLRTDMAKGRKDEENLVPAHVVPFFDLMIIESGIDKNNTELAEKTAKIAEFIFARIKEYVMIPNYKQKSNELKQLETAIGDELEYCGIELLKKTAAKLTNELIRLGESRESEVRCS